MDERAIVIDTLKVLLTMMVLWSAIAVALKWRVDTVSVSSWVFLAILFIWSEL